MSGPAEDLVRETAALARLELTEDEVARLAPQFARILAAFETIASLDVGAAEAMASATRAGARSRDDVAEPSLAVEEALANAPEHEDGYYRVPRTLPAPPGGRGTNGNEG